MGTGFSGWTVWLALMLGYFIGVVVADTETFKGKLLVAIIGLAFYAILLIADHLFLR